MTINVTLNVTGDPDDSHSEDPMNSTEIAKIGTSTFVAVLGLVFNILSLLYYLRKDNKGLR